MDTCPICPLCNSLLEPPTLAPGTTESFGFCPRCQVLFASCFHCESLTSQVTANSRICRNPPCSTFGRASTKCPSCGFWSLVAENNLSGTCRNTACAPAMETLPRVNNPIVPTEGAPPSLMDSVKALGETGHSNIEALLDQIARLSHFEERYEIQGEVEAGGMGVIIAGFDRILRRKVAIKLQRTQMSDAASRGQFLKEARVGGRLLHPNVLSVFDLGVNLDRQIYFTMRHVEGVSMERNLRAVETAVATNIVAFPLVRMLEGFVRSCHGVEFAHRNGVIHLDLKPQNILMSGFSEVFVVDWGLALVDEEDDSERLVDLYRDWNGEQSSTGCFSVAGACVVGTPAYMAPEQARGEVNLFAPHTDVFGLGAILYYILYGQSPNYLPGGTKNLKAVLDNVSQPKKRLPLRAGILPRGVRIPVEVRDSLAAMEEISLKALMIDPAERFVCVEDFIIELNEWLRHTPFRSWRETVGAV